MSLTSWKKAVGSTSALVATFGMAATALAITITIPNLIGVSTDNQVQLPNVDMAGAIAAANPAIITVAVVNVPAKLYVVSTVGFTQNLTPNTPKFVTNNAVVGAALQAPATTLEGLVGSPLATALPTNSIYVVTQDLKPATMGPDALAVGVGVGPLN